MNAIETFGLTKSYKGVKAVDALELRIPEGSIYGFLGPNGAGKTTTVKMLTGLSRPSGGTIRICGKPAGFGRSENRGDIGFLPDVPNFYDWMAPVEFLRLCGRLLNMDGRALNERVESLLELVGLSGVKKRIGGFSRGMKQRLGIAQALMGSPKVVFLDEPTSALDPAGRKEILDIVSKLSGQATVFFSTHILSDVERICDRVLILNKGRVVLEDSIDRLHHNYAGRSILLEVMHTEKIPELMERLARCGWLEKASEGPDGGLVLEVKDAGIAGMELPGILDGVSAGLKKLVPAEATLEDIFMKAVEKT